MKQLGIIANVGKARATDVLRRILAKAQDLKLNLCADAATAALAPGLRATTADGFGAVDAVMALGGDGTMLRAFRQLGGRDIPLIGINLGALGFLTSVAEAELERAMDCLARDEVAFSRRSVAQCIVMRAGTEIGRHAALNDVVIGGGASARVITLNVDVGGDRVASYMCDGLIVSTPTGSTGHNLSAGGPIILPETRAFVISLICPHTLSSRPLVVPETSEITIQAGRPNELGFVLSVDGQAAPVLKDTDVVHVHASQERVRFIHLPGHSHFGVMSQKLGWKGSNVR